MTETFEDQVKRASEIVQTSRWASTSLLQRKMRIGLAQAMALMDELESRGIVEPPDGAKPRGIMNLEKIRAVDMNLDNIRAIDMNLDNIRAIDMNLDNVRGVDMNLDKIRGGTHPSPEASTISGS